MEQQSAAHGDIHTVNCLISALLLPSLSESMFLVIFKIYFHLACIILYADNVLINFIFTHIQRIVFDAH